MAQTVNIQAQVRSQLVIVEMRVKQSITHLKQYLHINIASCTNVKFGSGIGHLGRT